MRELNVDYMDLYKRVDNFIKNRLGSKEGVSEYLRVMEEKEPLGSLRVASWNAERKTLKHLRWIRNQLAHEVGYDSDLVEKRDYEDLAAFFDRLKTSRDALSVLERVERERKAKRDAAAKAKKPAAKTTGTPVNIGNEQRTGRKNAGTQEEPELKLWDLYPAGSRKKPKKETFFARVRRFLFGSER